MYRIVSLFILILAMSSPTRAHTDRVFVLHSYGYDYPWTRGQHDHFSATLRALLPHPVKLNVEHLDTKRNTFTQAYQDLYRDYLRTKYRDYRPDLVYVSDDNALRFARRYLTGIFPGTPIIFSGVNDYTILDSLSPQRITGVMEKKSIQPNLDIIKGRAAGLSRIAFVGDGSNTYRAIRREIMRELDFVSGVEPMFIASDRISDVTAVLQRVPVDYVLLTTLGAMKDDAGHSLLIEQIIDTIVAGGDFVVLTMEDIYLRPGVLGGYVTSARRQGEQAARLAAEYLNGKPLAQIPPVLASPNEYLFDQLALTRHGIELAPAVRAAATIINQPPSFYESNRRLIMGGLVASGLLLFLTLAVSAVQLSRKNREIRANIGKLTQRQAEIDEIKGSLEQAQQIARMGNWDWDIKNNRLFWSAGIYQLFGLDPRVSVPDYESFLERVHPDDRERVDGRVREALDVGSEYSVEHRIVRPDHSMRVVLEKGNVIRNARGEAERMIGMVRDVTAEREIEEHLRASEESYRGLFNSVSEAIYILDTAGRFLDVNQGAVDMYECSRDELIGRTPAELAAPELNDMDAIRRRVERALSGETQLFEFWGRRRNGQVFPKEVRLYKGSYFGQDVVIVFATDITERKRTEARLQDLAAFDSLTNLPNRNTLLDRLEQAIRRAQRDDHVLAVLFLDVDRFKQINDSFGHTVGDKLLREVAARLRMLVRTEDTVARLGGDEFVILLEDIADPQDARVVADKVVDVIGQPFQVDGYDMFVTPSIGISIYPADGADADTLLKNADAAMYHAKSLGRNAYSFYTVEITAQVAARVDLEKRLREALNDGLLEMHYQPVYELAAGRLVGAEALVRWEDRDTGFIGPDRFIPVAEDCGLIIPLGNWVLRRVCATARDWYSRGLLQDCMHVNVNISGIQLIQPDFVAQIREILRDTGLPPTLLNMELTEGVLLENRKEAAESLRELVALGIGIAIDDFGTGYSSLSYLKELPIGTIKIDRSFVRDIMQDNNDRAITWAIIALAQSLDLQVVAEGIEDEDQLRFLIERGCETGQGYFYSRPLPSRDFEILLERAGESAYESQSSQ